MLDIQRFSTYVIAFSILIPVFKAIIQSVKKGFGINKRWIPLLAAGIGLALGLIFIEFSLIGGLIGIIFGFSAVGFHEVFTKFIGK